MAEFSFTDEQAQLRSAVRKFCADNFGEEAARRLMESDPPFDRTVWGRLGAELGVLGLSVPEDDGGAGGTLVDQAIAVEELGAALACGPLFGTVVSGDPGAGRRLGRTGARPNCCRTWSRAGGPPRSRSPTGPAPSIRRR